MRLKLLIWRWRFPLAALVLALAIVSALQILAPHQPTAAVLVITTPVAAGEELGPENTQVKQVPSEVLPQGVLAELPATQTFATVALYPKQVLTDALTTQGAVQAVRPGYSALTIPVTESALVIATPGTAIDLYAAPTDCQDTCQAEMVGQGAIVLSTKTAGSSLLADDYGTYVTVSLPVSQCAKVLGALGNQPFAVARSA